MTAFFGFHPLIEHWFQSRFAAPTEPQRLGWPAIARGEHTLIAAPTGSGKTLTGFLACIDRLVKLGLDDKLTDETRVVYVSPLRALSNDMHRNLEVPLQEITALAHSEGVPLPQITVGLRTGDTPASQRASLVRQPRHILVTTPESLYLMLTGPKSRQTLRTVETLIVDEIHALVRDKRGSHLALTLERLEALCGRRLQRIGLSATQKPIERVARFLVGTNDDEARRAGSVSDRSDSPLQFNERQRRLFCIGNAAAGNGDANGRGSTPVADAPGSPGTSVADVPGSPNCTIIDIGHGRELDLAIEVPPSELGAVCMHEQWAEVYARVVELINAHRSTLVFVNTRRMAERVTHQLSELLGEDKVGSHHGSLSAEIRLKTERQLKAGELKAVVATASLELGLDVGYIDLVIQIGSPRSIATFLQRIGRSGHSLGLVPKGRLFALTRDELLESMALIRAVRAGRLDMVPPIPEAPLDVLAQQIVAEVATGEQHVDDLFALCRRAFPYRHLDRRDFERTIEYLSEGLTPSAGRSRVYLHYDRVGRRLRPRKGSRIAAVTNAGAIPDIASYRVVAEPEGTVVGSLDEEFAVESQRGDIFLLGNTSWRIQHVRGGDVTVIDAQGAPPTIPFWQGEAPGRTFELSEEVSRLREELEARLPSPLPLSQGERGSESDTVHLSGPPASHPSPLGREAGSPSRPTPPGRGVGSPFRPSPSGRGVGGEGASAASKLEAWLMAETSCSPFAARQTLDYAAAQKAAIGLLPTQRRVVFERFFDETGGMQLVVHAPFGGAINRAWGLAMRKRFCRSFDFELQATADNDGFILSLGPQHSFPIESLFPMLGTRNARGLLEQAVLTTPMFQVRWRWNVTRALLVLRMQNGKKVPPAFQRFRADDLLTALFPKLTGCQENVVGDLELPDHPLTRQTMEDCLHEALDIDGLESVLEAIERGEIALIARDTREPSPFSYELLNANVYAFLDGGEVQERRARAVATRRTFTVESVSDLGRLDPDAIELVRRDVQPLVRSADELHDVLLSRIVLPTDEAAGWEAWYQSLCDERRASTLALPNGRTGWIAAERLPAALAAFAEAACSPPLDVPEGVRRDWSAVEARVALVRGLIETSGPITARGVAERIGITPEQTAAALEALEGEGAVLRGHFTPFSRDAEALRSGARATPNALRSEDSASRLNDDVEWCHRRLLARIHRLTLEGLRKQIEPVGVDVFIRCLTHHHGLPVAGAERRSGTNGLFEVVAMLQGIDVPAVAWERDLLPARLEDYRQEWLDELCLTGEVGWGRLFPSKQNPDKAKPMASLTRVAPVSLWLRSDVAWLATAKPERSLSSPAELVLELLSQRGALFSADLMNETQMLPSQLEDALGELVAGGLVTADGFAGLRQLIAEKPTYSRSGKRTRPGLARRRKSSGVAGRWSIWRRSAAAENESSQKEFIEEWAWQLLRRWGVVFRDLLVRETGAPSWFELLGVYRRLEARGEIRGGRFVSGVAGEQFALGETVRKLRQLRDEVSGGVVSGRAASADEAALHHSPLTPHHSPTATHHSPTSELVVLSAADPLNLIGILTNHPRVPSTASNKIAYWNGVPAACLQAGELTWLAKLPTEMAAPIVAAFGVREQLGSMPLTINGDQPTADTENAAEATEKSADSSNASKKATSRPPRAGIPRPLIS